MLSRPRLTLLVPSLEPIFQGAVLAIALLVWSGLAWSQSRDQDRVPAAGPTELIEVLKRHVWPDLDLITRMNAQRRLEKLGREAPITVVPLLVRELSAPRRYGKKASHQRLALIETLRDIGPAAEEAVPVLIEVLHDPEEWNDWVKMAARMALGQIGSPLAKQALSENETRQAEQTDTRILAAAAIDRFFDNDPVDKIPSGWSIRETRPTNKLATWRVVADPTAPSEPNVFALTKTENHNGTFNLAIVENGRFTDIDLTVKVKAVNGEEDQGGGPMWRCKDENNYYVCRFNPLEGNFRVYYVKNGRRKQLDSANVRTDPGKWYTVGVRMERNRIACYLDGRKYLEVQDDTFTSGGMIGLWTKADAVTFFDELTVRELHDQGVGHDQDSVRATPPLVWEVTYTSRPPSIDGVIDKVWATATPLTVVVREALGGGDPREVVVRALCTDDTLYVLAQWPDTTRSDMRDPYVWNPQTKQYDRPTRPDDQFAVEFPMAGDFEISMLPTGTGFVADVWHWKAGRTNPGGWSDDKQHIIGQTPVKGAKKYDLGGRATVYIARPMDEGEPSYARKAKPTAYSFDVVNSYVSQQPSGSAADVRAKGLHDGVAWTLEISRKLNTGHSDDAVIEANEDTPCAIAILDDELYWRHSVSQLLLLRFAAR